MPTYQVNFGFKAMHIEVAMKLFFIFLLKSYGILLKNYKLLTFYTMTTIIYTAKAIPLYLFCLYIYIYIYSIYNEIFFLELIKHYVYLINQTF